MKKFLAAMAVMAAMAPPMFAPGLRGTPKLVGKAPSQPYPKAFSYGPGRMGAEQKPLDEEEKKKLAAAEARRQKRALKNQQLVQKHAERKSTCE